ncbi:ABC transporter substrate-binding protein [Alpinimonas psychrophila]|uniref:Branched-chain amino acid transport system substrate-binding protein n=1 Tax=Alpinimonas psychrophila TaxID=748908 RepID=A0A7W3JVF0_9MICO|nr:ABC transporter substrate-binding protein [Alpinimonas psychrophila]MBA8829943.1 branched-chain amino acid transport system substrate-binding protein [Alpinimonas psychrophila]
MSVISRRSRALGGFAVLASSALLLAGCASGSTGTATTAAAAAYKAIDCAAGATSADTLKVGGLLPVTGSLSFLGPPEIAGVGLAIADINAAGGVGGKDVCYYGKDSGDSSDMAVSTASAQDLIKNNVSVVIGAASSSVSLNVVDSFTAAKIVEISGANTSAKLSGYSPFYFRTAPPDTVQGSALGQLVTGDGNASVAFIVFNDSYGTGLRDATQAAIETAGGKVVYGGKGMGQEFPPGQTTFSSEVTAALAAKPDAVVVVAFDETKSIVPEMVNQGWTMSKTYFTDGNTASYEKDFQAGTLAGAQGTIPGASPSSDLKVRLSDWNVAVQGAALTDFTYAAESYDATTLAALAAVKGGKTDPVTIQANMAAVSGANGGTKCATFADCVVLIKDGKDIQYQGPSSIGPFNAKNDPSSAFIGIYKFDAKNIPVWGSAVEGKS